MTTRKRKTTVEVNVNRDMIDQALTQRSTLCAIALAIRDADPDGNFERPWVTQEHIAFTDRKTDQRYVFDAEQIPEEIKTWIDKFDRDPSKVKPFEFTLDLTQARVVPRKRQTVEQAVKKWHKNHDAPVRTTQKKIPAALKSGIKNTTKRELRDVDV